MRVFTFVLLWVGIIVVISLLNYHPTYIEVNEDNKKEKRKKGKDNYEENNIKIEKNIVKPPYVYLILGLMFLPIATIFVSSIIINKALIAPYILLATKGIKNFISAYDVVSYIIIIEIVILFSALFFRNIRLNRFIKSIVRFAISISTVLFLLALIIHLI